MWFGALWCFDNKFFIIYNARHSEDGVRYIDLIISAFLCLSRYEKKWKLIVDGFVFNSDELELNFLDIEIENSFRFFFLPLAHCLFTFGFE